MVNKSLIKSGSSRALGPFRSAWAGYKNADWRGWHVIVPAGLGAAAVVLLTWAWTMLDQGEYLAAMLFLVAVLPIGVGAALAIINRTVRIIALAAILVAVCFSAAVIWKRGKDKSWSILWAEPPPPVKSVPEPVPSSVMRGLLLPGQDPTPSNPCSEEGMIPLGAAVVIFGYQAAVTSGAQLTILRIAGEDMLSFHRSTEGVALNAIIRNRDGDEVGRVKENVFRALYQDGYYADRPDSHTFVILGPEDQKMLYVRYLNETAIEVRGIFNHAGRKPIIVDRATISEGVLSFGNCWANYTQDEHGPLFPAVP